MDYAKVLNIGLDFPAAQVSAIYGFSGTNTAMDSACTTGITSIDYAISALKADPNMDAMVVGGADHLCEPINIFWFQSFIAKSGSEPAPGKNSSLKPSTLFQIFLCTKCGAQVEP